MRPQIGNGVSVEGDVFVTDSNPLGFAFILGMNGTVALGGVAVDTERQVRFGTDGMAVCGASEAVISVEERDFSATFDPVTNSWTAMRK